MFPWLARMALKEKQIQQIYRPIIGVHKWFAPPFPALCFVA